MPWIHCKNLASRILALTTKRLPDDWQTRYAYRPVLLETFVEKPRFTGTCYKAANWQLLGDTKGRGKLDTLHRHAQPIKSIWIYPLAPDFQRQLCNTQIKIDADHLVYDFVPSEMCGIESSTEANL